MRELRRRKHLNNFTRYAGHAMHDYCSGYCAPAIEFDSKIFTW